MNRKRWIIAILCLVVMGSGLAALLPIRQNRKLGQPGIHTQPLSNGRCKILLPEIPGYVHREVEPSQQELTMLPRDTSFGKRFYRAPDGFEVFVNVVLMGTDRTSIHKPEFCLTSQGWRIIGEQTISIPIAKPRPYTLKARLFTTAKEIQLPTGETRPIRGLYLFWFVADGRLATGHFERIGWMVWDLLRTGAMPRWAYIACFSTCYPGKEKLTLARMKKFVAELAPRLQTFCPVTRKNDTKRQPE